MSQSFKLALAQPGGISSICPATGEELGQALARFAETEIARLAAPHKCGWIPEILYLAAEAYEMGASASIGHNRSDRYESAARGLRRTAENLEEQSRVENSNEQAKNLMVAFQDGYEGLDGKRYCFDQREAFLLGKYYAERGAEIPERINKIYSPRPLSRDSERDHLLVDGEKFVVDYPDGKVANAIVTKI